MVVKIFGNLQLKWGTKLENCGGLEQDVYVGQRMNLNLSQAPPPEACFQVEARLAEGPRSKAENAPRGVSGVWTEAHCQGRDTVASRSKAGAE